MGRVIIQEHTTKNPIQLIGEEAGVCWGSDINDGEKNYKRGLDCLASGHGRTFEFPDVYMILDEYSARVIREFYTHIGGSPTRLQASTRYINYEDGFNYVTPPRIAANQQANDTYTRLMDNILSCLHELDELKIPREDIAMGLPLGMTTKVVVKINLRTLIDMSRQRLCSRAYWEYRQLFNDLIKALNEYSPEWEYITTHYFKPKCEVYGYCTEKKTCGRKPSIQM